MFNTSIFTQQSQAVNGGVLVELYLQ